MNESFYEQITSFDTNAHGTCWTVKEDNITGPLQTLFFTITHVRGHFSFVTYFVQINYLHHSLQWSFLYYGHKFLKISGIKKDRLVWHCHVVPDNIKLLISLNTNILMITGS